MISFLLAFTKIIHFLFLLHSIFLSLILPHCSYLSFTLSIFSTLRVIHTTFFHPSISSISISFSTFSFFSTATKFLELKVAASTLNREKLWRNHNRCSPLFSFKKIIIRFTRISIALVIDISKLFLYTMARSYYFFRHTWVQNADVCL